MRSHVLDAQEREQRQREQRAAPLIAELFPGIGELAVRMTFADPEGKEKPQPYGQLFEPDMRAFFRFQCPLHDCVGGGFDLSAAVPRGVARKDSGSGAATCQGQRRRANGDSGRCNLQLAYTVVTVAARTVERPAPLRGAR